MGIHFCLFLQMNFDFKENSGWKSFSCKTKASISCISMKWTCLWRPITKRMEIIMSFHVCLIWRMNFDSKDNGGKKKLFLQKQSINIVYPNEMSIIGVPITKWIEIIMSVQTNQSINIVYPNEKNMIAVPITKRMDIIKSIHVCPHSQWSLIIRKMVERKLFLANQSINIM